MCTLQSENYHCLGCKILLLGNIRKDIWAFSMVACWLKYQGSALTSNTNPIPLGCGFMKATHFTSRVGRSGRRARASCLGLHAPPFGWKQSKPPVPCFALSFIWPILPSQLPHEKALCHPVGQAGPVRL